MIEWLVRRVWGFSLWLMRRRWIIALQRFPCRFMSPERAERHRQALRHQNAMGLKWGRKMIRISLWTCWLCILFEVLYALLASYVINLPGMAT